MPPADKTPDPAILATSVDLFDEVRAAAPLIEAERRLPPGLVEVFLDAGLFHIMLPASLGGPELHPLTAARVVEEIARADGSAGWTVMIAAQNAGLAGFMPRAAAQQIWGPRDIVGGTARPIGRALAVDRPEPGFTIDGRWPFASGSSHATWFAGECEVFDGDQRRLDARGEGVTRVVFVPREEVVVHDVWFTTGLRGTASNDFSIAGSFVPAARGFQMIVDEPLDPWPLYRALGLVFMNHGSQAIGVARAALETAREVFLSKRGWGGVALSGQPRIQAVVAEATVLIESARQYLYLAANELWAALQGETPEPTLAALRARLRLAASHCVDASVEAVDLLHRTVGTTGIMTASPLDRQFRDIHTAAAHVMVGPLTYEAAGRVELGFEAEFPFF